MHYSHLCLFLLATALAADDKTTTKASLVVASVSEKTEITNAKTASNFNTIRVTIGTTTSSSSSRLHTPTTTTAASSDITEDSNDSALFKIALTMPPDDAYYNAKFTVGAGNLTSEVLDLRLDIVQPDIWVMDGAEYYDCDAINSWYVSEEGTGTDVPSSVTTNPYYEATVCGAGGLYTALATASQDDSPSYAIPYVNELEAVGNFALANLSFSLANEQSVKLSDFTFLSVSETNVFYGGLGLAGNPAGTGLLNALVEKGYIKSRGYSLWFNSYVDFDLALGELIPGVVDQKYYQDPLYAFEMLPIEGDRYKGAWSSVNSGIADLKLPTLLLDDISVGNDLTGQKISLKPDTDPLPVILDSRTTHNYLPLEIIVNIAIQTNAFYSAEAGRWLVECDKIADSSASLYFKFNKLDIKIPITNFITEAVWYKNTLKFQNGKKACFLDFSPAAGHGFNALGLSFLTGVYLAVDNDGGYVALANSNSLLQVAVDDLVKSEAPTRLFSQSAIPSNVTVIHSSIGYIESGTIPFATTVSSSGNQIAFSISVPATQSKDSDAVPARFSGAIANGETVITGGPNGITTTYLPGMTASAASPNTTKSGGAPPLINPMAAFVSGMPFDFYGLSIIVSVLFGMVCFL